MVCCSRRLIRYLGSVSRPHNLFLGKVCSTLFNKVVSRVAELGSLSWGVKMGTTIFVKRVITIFASNASFQRVIANLQN